MKRIGIIIGCALLAISVSGQKTSYATDFKRISEAYSDAKNFSADVVVFSYKDKDQEKGDLLGKGMIRKADKNYYSKFMGEEMITNNHCAVIVDSNYKEVTIFQDNKKVMPGQFSLSQMDSMLKKQDSVSYLGSQNGLKHYVLYNKHSVIMKIDMYVGEKDHFIKRLVYYYAASGKDESYDMYKMDIYYNNIKLDKVSDSYFSEKKYIEYKGSTPQLTATYRKYKLIIADKYKAPK